jgi:hypothetical protein
MEVVQDEQSGLTLQTTVRGVTFKINAALIGSFIGTDPVPFEGIPFPYFIDPPYMEELLEFFDPHHRAQDKVPHSIRIGLFSSLHRGQSPSFDQDWLIFLSASSSHKDYATQFMAYSSTE